MMLKSLAAVAAVAAAAGALAAATPAFATGGASFLMNGLPGDDPWKLQNTSTAGETITSFTFELPPASGGDHLVFSSSPGFQELSGAGDDPGALPLTVADMSTSFTQLFTSFSPGIFDRFTLGVRRVDATGATVVGLSSVDGGSLVGSMITIDFSDGTRGSTFLVAEGAATGDNSGAAGVVAGVAGAPGVPEPASWALMLAGFGGLGAALRAQRRMRLAV